MAQKQQQRQRQQQQQPRRRRGGRRGVGTGSLVLLSVVFSTCLVSSVRSHGASCDGVAPSYAPPPRGQPPDAVKLEDAAFVRVLDGSRVQLKAISWHGVHANLTAASLASLWSAGDASAVGDLATLAFRLRALGFNAVRLPFSFADLRLPARNAWADQGCVKVTLNASAQQQQEQQAAAAGADHADGGDGGGRCRWYLPDGGAARDRYLWALQWLSANGLYVLAEFSPSPADAALLRDERAFADAWRWLWGSGIACLPNFDADLKGRVFAGLLAGPDRAGLRWEAVGGGGGGGGGAGGSPGLAALYLAAMDAAWGAAAVDDGGGSQGGGQGGQGSDSGALFLVEGAAQGGASRWGHGFVTDRELIAVSDYSDPNPFFRALLSKPYRASVVLSPSVYDTSAPPPPDDPTDPNRRGPPLPVWPAGPGPVKVMDTTFGYLSREGYCDPPARPGADHGDVVDSDDDGDGGDGDAGHGGGADKRGARDCQRFPVAVGEFASPLAAARPELAALNAFAAHLSAAGVEYDGVGTWRFWGFESGSGGGNGGGASEA